MRLCFKLLSIACFANILLYANTINSPDVSLKTEDTEKKPDADEPLNTEYAQIQWVDKFTGRFKSIYAKTGTTTIEGHLKIKVAVCRGSALFDPPDSKAFLTIWEYPPEDLPRKLFTGWMLASSPALSTLINHPRYNIWLLKCTNKIIPPSK